MSIRQSHKAGYAADARRHVTCRLARLLNGACKMRAAKPTSLCPASCNERGPVQCVCSPVAMILGRVATIMGRTVAASCNQCGPAGAMIAVPSADVCGPLQIALPDVAAIFGQPIVYFV
jgi:hypothetical protein